MIAKPRFGQWALALTLASLAAGCDSGENDGRREVSGSVLLDGEPLGEGTITFVPEQAGLAAGAEIRDGSFKVDRATGPTAGTYLVEIDAIRPTGRIIPNPDLPGETVEETINAIPLRYNRKTELRASISEAGGDELRFELTSKP